MKPEMISFFCRIIVLEFQHLKAEIDVLKSVYVKQCNTDDGQSKELNMKNLAFHKENGTLLFKDGPDNQGEQQMVTVLLRERRSKASNDTNSKKPVNKKKRRRNKKKKCACRGKRGLRGFKGKTGLPGRNGNDGSPGAKGSMGYPGIPGTYGPEGPQGPKGDAGNAGITGSQGPKGDTGSKGDRGDPGLPAQGIKGDKGEPGSPCISKSAHYTVTVPPLAIATDYKKLCDQKWDGIYCSRNATYWSNKKNEVIKFLTDISTSDKMGTNTRIDISPLKALQNGEYMVQETGHYMISLNLILVVAHTREEVGVFVDDIEKLKCKDSIDYVHAGSSAMFNSKQKTCSVNGVLYIEKGQKITFRIITARTIILVERKSTYVGVVLL